MTPADRVRRTAKFAEGFTHGADPAHARKRIDAEIAGDPDWRAGVAAARGARALALEGFDGALRVELAVARSPALYHDGFVPYAHVVDGQGRIKRHPYEPPHDDPSPGPCWYCLREEDDKVHRR